MKFWRLTPDPRIESDYQRILVNGQLDHPYSIPGIRCESCGTTWGGSNILPYELPKSLRRRKHLKDCWPIPSSKHIKLQAEVLRVLRAEGVRIDRLKPGVSFQPSYLDIASMPRADFLWPSLTCVVTEPIKLLLEHYCDEGVAFARVNLRKVGKREAALPAPLPATGEPEDIVNDVPLLEDVSAVGPYYEICVMAESDWPPGAEPVGHCDTCGRNEIDHEARQLVMKSEMWKGNAMFLLATTLHIIVTDELKKVLQGIAPTNLAFEHADVPK